jgi:Kef-type K+ transport system membrane component KefB
MGKNKNFLFYFAVIGISAVLIWIVLVQGKHLETFDTGVNSAAKTEIQNSAGDITFAEQFVQSLHHPLAILILQIISIIVVSRIFGYLFNKIHQPTVIGEIVAGIFLGPSVLGVFFPEISAFMFPVQSLGNLQFLSQIGLIFFMFIIGMELDLKIIRNKAHAAVVISHSSIIFPYLLGVILAYFLYSDFAPEGVSFLPFALFMGIAMSITAFPVLARIIQEKGITKTNLGTMALTCAAADDITAWCILAAVVAIVNAGSILNSIYVIALSITYVFFMIKIVQPFLNRIGAIYISRENLSKTIVAFVFIILLGSAYLTEIIGIHALFGAFLAGTIMPQNLNFKRIIVEKIEDVSLVVLLPLFFVFTGLRTQIGLLNEPGLWLVCLLIVAVAITGKFGGSAIAAKFVGLSWKESLSIGTLMNTRGLMELIVLNLGYDLGILSPSVFAMMVLMALITTFATGPALEFINYLFKSDPRTSEINVPEKSFNVLISFAHYTMGSKLLKLAYKLSCNIPVKTYWAMHFTPSTEINTKDALIYEKESFQPVKKTAEELGIDLHTIYKSTDNVRKEIIDTARDHNFSLLMLGSAKAVFSDNQLGGKIKNFLEHTSRSTSVLIDKNFENANNVLVLLNNRKDEFIIQYINNLLQCNASASVVVMDKDFHINDFITAGRAEIKDLNYMASLLKDENLLKEYDLIITSMNYWNAMSETIKELLEGGPSVLLFKP